MEFERFYEVLMKFCEREGIVLTDLLDNLEEYEGNCLKDKVEDCYDCFIENKDPLSNFFINSFEWMYSNRDEDYWSKIHIKFQDYFRYEMVLDINEITAKIEGESDELVSADELLKIANNTMYDKHKGLFKLINKELTAMAKNGGIAELLLEKDELGKLGISDRRYIRNFLIDKGYSADFDREGLVIWIARPDGR